MSRVTSHQAGWRYVIWAALCLTVVIAAAACSGGGNQSAPSSESTSAAVSSSTAVPAPVQPAPASAQITIDGFKYTENVTVAPGGQVTVINKDSAKHTVTSNTPGLFDTQVDGNGQATFTAPTAPGSYPYHCNYHASMHGVLVVQ
jgi:plastocyanin